MKVHTADGKLFSLTAENEQDKLFLDAVDVSHVLLIEGFDREARGNAFCNVAVNLTVDAQDSRALSADIGRHLTSSFSKLVRLTLTELQRDHVAKFGTSHPDAKKGVSIALEELEFMKTAVAVHIGAQNGRPEEVPQIRHDGSVAADSLVEAIADGAAS